MLIYEILKVKQPDVFSLLCRVFGIDEENLATQHGVVEWFDPVWEMTHDSERYLNYTSRAMKV